MRLLFRLIPGLLSLMLLSVGPAGLAMDSDEEDELLTPEDDLVADILAAYREFVEEGPEKDKKSKKELKFKQVIVDLAIGEPVIDGDLSDEFWEQAHTVDLEYEVSPARLAQAKLFTYAWFAASDSHIFVAFDARDPRPDLIRSARRAHDGGKEDDYVSFSIDPVGTGSRRYEFRVNPHGATGDSIIDSVADRGSHDWDADWEAAAQRHPGGYRVEMKIPIASVRPPANVIEGRRGVMFFKRFIPRRLKTVNASFVIYDANNYLEKIKLYRAVHPPAAPSTRERISGKAHVVFHPDEKRKLGEDDWEQVPEHDEYSAGVSMFYQIDRSRQFGISLYPNFVDVEGDIARDGLSKAFKKFRPEKRPVFRAASEYYTSTVPAVYTRNIKQPRIATIYTHDDAYRATSGFYVNDRETEVIIPDTFSNERVKLLETSNSAAFRSREFGLDGNAWGVLGTFREATDYHNLVAGADGMWNIDDDNKLRWQVLGSHSEYPTRFAEDVCEKGDCLGEDFPEDITDCPIGDCSLNAQVLRTSPGDTLTGHYLKARYKNSTHRGEYFVDYYQVSPDFRGDLGFIRQVDYRVLSAMYGKKWYRTLSEKDGGRSRIRAYVNALHGRSYEDNTEISTKFGAFVELTGSYQTRISIGKSIGDKATGRINQAILAVEDNANLIPEDYWLLKFNTSPFGNWKFDLVARVGEVADKNTQQQVDMVEISPIIDYRIRNFEFRLETIFRDVDLDGTMLYDENWWTIKAFWRPNDRMSHRILYLLDFGKYDTGRLPTQNNDEEEDRRVEYTFTYKPNRDWTVLTGVKGEWDYRSKSDLSDWVNREFYFKLERNF